MEKTKSRTNYYISVFGHILEDGHNISVKDEHLIEYPKNSLRQVKGFIFNYWYSKDKMDGVYHILKKIDLVLGQDRIKHTNKFKPKPRAKPRGKNIGTQTSLDLFGDM